MGDPTAAAMGRVSLNPLAHIDPFGTVLLPLILVAHRARRSSAGPSRSWSIPGTSAIPRRDNLWISLAGPAANLTAAAVRSPLILLIKALSPARRRSSATSSPNAAFPPGFYPLEGLALILFYAVLVNTYLAVFNLIPVPPLDGSGVLAGLLSDAGRGELRPAPALRLLHRPRPDLRSGSSTSSSGPSRSHLDPRLFLACPNPPPRSRRSRRPPSRPSAEAPDGYQVRLDVFEGPLDLLLFLIRKKKIDIHDIPIAAITRDYLDYLDRKTEINLDREAEFLFIAALLIYIKSQMLLPRETDLAEARGPAPGPGRPPRRIPEGSRPPAPSSGSGRTSRSSSGRGTSSRRSTARASSSPWSSRSSTCPSPSSS